MKKILAILYAIIALRIAGGINSIQQIGNQETNADSKAHADEIYLDDHCSIRLLESSDSCIAEIRGSAGPEKSVTWRQYYRCSDNLFSEVFY